MLAQALDAAEIPKGGVRGARVRRYAMGEDVLCVRIEVPWAK